MRLGAFCTKNQGGPMTAGITPTLTSNDESDPRPVLVVDGQGSNADQSIEMVPFDVQFIELITSATVVGSESSFAILDSENTTASGVAAVSVDPASESCVITAHATG
jgi:hypothetical protein